MKGDVMWWQCNEMRHDNQPIFAIGRRRISPVNPKTCIHWGEGKRQDICGRERGRDGKLAKGWWPNQVKM
jgi:hypothetical protein